MNLPGHELGDELARNARRRVYRARFGDEEAVTRLLSPQDPSGRVAASRGVSIRNAVLRGIAPAGVVDVAMRDTLDGYGVRAQRLGQDPRWPRALDAGVLPTGEIYITTSWMAGEPLSVCLESLPDHARRQVIVEVAAILMALHGCGVAHGDLKATNLVWDPARGVGIIDLDTLRYLGDGFTSITTTDQTAAWSAPEQQHERLTYLASDVWAWAVLAERAYPQDMPAELAVAVSACAAPTPQARPTAASLVTYLTSKGAPLIDAHGATIVAAPYRPGNLDPVVRVAAAAPTDRTPADHAQPTDRSPLPPSAGSTEVYIAVDMTESTATPAPRRLRWAWAAAATVLVVATLTGWLAWRPVPTRVDISDTTVTILGDSALFPVVRVLDQRDEEMPAVPVRCSSTKGLRIGANQIEAKESGTFKVSCEASRGGGRLILGTFTVNAQLPHSVELPPLPVVDVGATVEVRPILRNERGEAIPGVSLRLASMDPSVLTVSGSTVHGVSEGKARLTANWQDLSTSLHVDVKKPNPWRGKDVCEMVRYHKTLPSHENSMKKRTEAFVAWQQGNDDTAWFSPCVRSYRQLVAVGDAQAAVEPVTYTTDAWLDDMETCHQELLKRCGAP